MQNILQGNAKVILKKILAMTLKGLRRKPEQV